MSTNLSHLLNPLPEVTCTGPSEVLSSALLGVFQKVEASLWWSEAWGDHSCIRELVRLNPRDSLMIRWPGSGGTKPPGESLP